MELFELGVCAVDYWYSVRRVICKGYWEMIYQILTKGKCILKGDVGTFV